jgi:2-octaprenylphenol hydroxylase
MADTLSRQVDIAIVGGGIAGLAAAAALSQQGLSLLLIESRPLPSSLEAGDDSVHGFDPRVSALTPRSIAFLTRLGAWAAVEGRRHCPYTHMTRLGCGGYGQYRLRRRRVGRPCSAIVENRLITAALAQRVAARAGLHMRRRRPWPRHPAR